ncbi:MAG: siderophore-interacting protein [Galactobacter sp.]
MAFADARKFKGHHVVKVTASERITPHMVRVTVQGESLHRLPVHGFDQWFRLFLPNPGGVTDFSRVPEQFGFGAYMKYLRTKAGVRPPFRNYTVRSLRPDVGEMDIDFVSHGDAGIAGPWAAQARPGEELMILDQGRGFDLPDDATEVLMAGDESALPAVLGVLRDLPAHITGHAIIEIPDAADQQEVEGESQVQLDWIVRDHSDTVGQAALKAFQQLVPTAADTAYGYTVGEQQLASGGRRHLVAQGVDKRRIGFVGYWKRGKAEA